MLICASTPGRTRRPLPVTFRSGTELSGVAATRAPVPRDCASGPATLSAHAAVAAPSHGAARAGLAEALFAKGRSEDALAVLRREPSQLGPPVDATLGYLLARSGYQHEARQVLKRLTGGPFPTPAYLAATVYAGLGDTAAAMQQLERAYAEHSGWIVFLKSQRAWDSMRSDPRFRSLLRKVSLDS